jgi:hypothetical protein
VTFQHKRVITTSEAFSINVYLISFIINAICCGLNLLVKSTVNAIFHNNVLVIAAGSVCMVFRRDLRAGKSLLISGGLGETTKTRSEVTSLSGPDLSLRALMIIDRLVQG